MTSSNTDFWRGWSGDPAHPASPAGGGGPGKFTSAAMTCAWGQSPEATASDTWSAHFGSAFASASLSALPHPDSLAARQFDTTALKPAVSAMRFGVRDLPGVMRGRLGWPKSAALMELWFSKMQRAMSPLEKQDGSTGPKFPKEFRDTSLVTMDWLLSFERASLAYQSLLKSLSSPNALKAIAGMALGWPTGAGSATGIDIAEVHATRQFQFSTVGYGSEFDDLYGSLGKFGLFAAILDWNISDSAAKGRRTLKITKVATYMRDTFDFLGGQYLGHWNESGMGIVAGAGIAASISSEAEWHLPAWHPRLGWMTPVNNSDFRSWQSSKGSGGDLLLFSDTKTEPVDITVEL